MRDTELCKIKEAITAGAPLEPTLDVLRDFNTVSEEEANALRAVAPEATNGLDKLSEVLNQDWALMAPDQSLEQIIGALEQEGLTDIAEELHGILAGGTSE